MSELSIHELEAQHGEVLPEREALAVPIFSFNKTVAHIHASNHSSVTQYGLLVNHQTGIATAEQTITIVNI